MWLPDQFLSACKRWPFQFRYCFSVGFCLYKITARQNAIKYELFRFDEGFFSVKDSIDYNSEPEWKKNGIYWQWRFPFFVIIISHLTIIFHATAWQISYRLLKSIRAMPPPPPLNHFVLINSFLRTIHDVFNCKSVHWRRRRGKWIVRKSKLYEIWIHFTVTTVECAERTIYRKRFAFSLPHLESVKCVLLVNCYFWTH